MNVLHIASFDGNIGDAINHNGFYRMFKEYVDKDVSWTRIEMREFYRSWNLRHFDEEFVQIANQHDLVLIGGGADFFG